MKVFISHTFSDEDQPLAIMLQKTLAEENIDGYLAEKKKEYDLLIRDKIRKEIQNSDHMVAIVTNNARESASVNQEIGFALREGIKPVIMLEKNAKLGVLIHGIEPEEFTKENFGQHCTIVRDFILKKGRRQKIDEEQMKELIQNVYEPCYNQLMNVFEKRNFLAEVPPNAWKKVSHRWKLKTELEMKELFEEYTKELEIWHKLFVERENDFFHQNKKIADHVTVAFQRANLIDQNNSIVLDERSTMQPKDWVHAFRNVLFDPANTNASELHRRLVEFSIQTSNGHERWLNRFNDRTDLFRYLATILPTIREDLIQEYKMNNYNHKDKNL